MGNEVVQNAAATQVVIQQAHEELVFLKDMYGAETDHGLKVQLLGMIQTAMSLQYQLALFRVVGGWDCPALRACALHVSQLADPNFKDPAARAKVIGLLEKDIARCRLNWPRA